MVSDAGAERETSLTDEQILEAIEPRRPAAAERLRHGGGRASAGTTVSYTHLDVYKRQDEHVALDEIAFLSDGEILALGFLGVIEQLSLIHI